MYTLYYSPGACSMAIHALLEELGQSCKLERVDLGAKRSPEFLKTNPRGQVPVLVDGDLAIRESAAIIQHLVEKHGSDLIPAAKGTARTKALQWLSFANASLHPAYSRVFWLLRVAKDNEALIKAAIENINAIWKDIDDQLADTKYIAGDKITAADILIAVIANWGIASFPQKPELGANVKRLVKEISARPAFAKVLKAEEIEYKAAA